jgi:hypothetical protein
MTNTTWQPIETAPFNPYFEMWISDGRSVRHVSVTKRLGHGMPLRVVTGDVEWPAWRHDWRLVDEESRDDEMYGKAELELDYSPTHWLPKERPEPPTTNTTEDRE